MIYNFINIEIAKEFSQNREEHYCLFEISISKENVDYNNLVLMADYSVYPTKKEILIKIGALLFVNKFETNKEICICCMTLISNSFEGLKFFFKTNS